LVSFEKHNTTMFFPGRGYPEKPFRMTFGALILKERLNVSVEELVVKICANILGLKEYRNEAHLDASMMNY
jgi:hypothetical protein